MRLLVAQCPPLIGEIEQIWGVIQPDALLLLARLGLEFQMHLVRHRVHVERNMRDLHVTRPDGETCLVASGEAWQTIPAKVRGPDA